VKPPPVFAILDSRRFILQIFKKQAQKNMCTLSNIYPQALNAPKKTAIQRQPLRKKNKNPPTPNRRNHVFQSFFSMFSNGLFPFGKIKCLLVK
jgi:hypothetical protein